jgi:hypothetical protein
MKGGGIVDSYEQKTFLIAAFQWNQELPVLEDKGAVFVGYARTLHRRRLRQKKN